jgi:hypothetical protein
MSWTAWKRYTRESIAKLPSRRGEYEIATRNKVSIASGGSDATTGVKGRLMERFIHNRHPTGYFFRCRYAAWGDSGIEMEGRTAKRHEARRGGKNLKDNIRSPRATFFWDI